MAAIEAFLARRARTTVVLGIVALVALAIAQLLANTNPGAAHQVHGDRNGGLFETLGQYAIAAGEGIVLYAIALTLQQRFGRAERIIVIVGVACIWGMMLGWPFTRSADPFAYVGYAKLPSVLDAYRPPVMPWTGDFRAIPIDWHDPMVPSVYGPLWLAFNRLVAGSATSLAGGVLLERCAATACYALVLVALRLLKLPLWLIAIAALDPAPATAFAQGGHNDALPLALVVFAMAAASRGRIGIGAALVGAAALAKISFVALAPVVVIDEPSWRRRLAACCGAAGIALAGSWLFGGHAYLAAVRAVGAAAHASDTIHPRHVLLDAIHVASATVVALALLGALLPRARRWAPATWAFWSISATWMPWYVSWCLPYAIRSRVALAFLASWPLSDAIVAHSLAHVYPFEFLAVFLAAAALRLIVRDGGVAGFTERLRDRHHGRQPVRA